MELGGGGGGGAGEAGNGGGFSGYRRTFPHPNSGNSFQLPIYIFVSHLISQTRSYDI